MSDCRHQTFKLRTFKLLNARIFHNGPMLTQTPAQPRAEALAVRGSEIVAVGSLEMVRQIAGPRATLLNLEGRTLLPAFHDPHIHLWKVGHLMTSMLDLRDVASIAEMQARLAEFAARHPQNPWILARGFNEAKLAEGRMPDRRDLDQAVADRPVQAIRTCAHIAVLNTKALTICGLEKNAPPPPGGEIRLDARGEPTGVLSETALGIPHRHIPPPAAADYRAMILAVQDALLEKGIACATDPAVHPELLAVYRQMEAAGELKIRVNAVPIRVPDGATEALPLPALFDSNFLKINTVKFFSDGGLSGQTAALKHFYKNQPGASGVLRLGFDFFKKCAAEAQSAGFRIATHAIGDRAIERVLDVYEAIGPTSAHRVEHLGLPELSHLARLKNLGVQCVSQPIFVWELGRNFRAALPDFYLENVYPYRSILDAGVPLAFSSDAPVVKNFDPLMGIQNAVERLDSEGYFIAKHQKINTVEAIFAYTNTAATVSGFAQTNGSLEVGKQADFVVLDKNPLEVPASEISKIQVEETWVAGVRQFARSKKILA
jgi:predicted amidohydrolase YtcJ